MSTEKRTAAPPIAEFIIIISMMMSLTALCIDAMLPALPEIADTLQVNNPNDRQLIISVILLGNAIGGLFFGPLSDNAGRKPTIYIGYALFIAGSLLSVFASSFPIMLAGRTLQGIGLSSPRAVVMALVRDQFEGRKMARVMSFASTIFILVPIIAPSVGQGILAFAGWRAIFGFFIVFALISLIWFAIRIPETLTPENRKPFSLRHIYRSTVEILNTRIALGFTLAVGLVQGFFLGYLNSSQQIFQEQYALGDLFPLFFAIMSISIGAASLANARLVMRFGMTQLVTWAAHLEFALAIVFLAITFLYTGQPPLWLFMTLLMMVFFCVGILFGNSNALAMQPLGHLAGIGSAIIGSLSTLISTLLGTVIGQFYNGTLIPLASGMALLSGLSIFVIHWAITERTVAIECSAAD